MIDGKTFLVEIGTEELPPKALRKLSEAFAEQIIAGIEKAQLEHGKSQVFAAPRRLAVSIEQLATQQETKSVQRRGPALTAAFDEDGVASKAAVGFASSCGVQVEDLEKLETNKGAWLVFNSEQQGKASTELLPDIVKHALDKLPIPKRMRWGSLNAQFVRPVHWVLMMLGEQAIDCEILSVRSSTQTFGHRFHHPEELQINSADEYNLLLETQGCVIPEFEARKQQVRIQVEEQAEQVGGKAVIDEELLDEVTAMVEWPIAVLGSFEAQFLQIPQEALITTMKNNQKYFYVVDEQFKLMPHFITVSNIDSSNIAVVQQGNERVIRPRFSDAEFFWNQDRKQKLESHVEGLKRVVFQAKLGSIHDKVQRVVELSSQIALALNTNSANAKRAALLSKCDLMTEMVSEFPSLQGIMGRYYAEHDGESQEVAQALDEQYMPRFAGDQVAQTASGQAVAIADKLDTIVGIFAIKQIPTGDKDPFGLRRAALGVLRSIIENKLDLNLKELINIASVSYAKTLTNIDEPELCTQVYDFIMERLRAYYQDMAVAHDTFDAVLHLKPAQPYDFDRRIHAVSMFRDLPQAESLAAANKRIANILKKAGAMHAAEFDPSLLQEAAEKSLAEKLNELSTQLTAVFEQRQYQEALTQLASLRDAVDEFFDNVMVMAEDESLKNNRVALLNDLRQLFLQVADISQLQETAKV